MEQIKFSIFKITLLSLVINTVYAIANLYIGISIYSWWFITIGIYYIILSFTRLALVALRRRESYKISQFTGIMLMLTAFPLFSTAMISAVKDVETKFHEIVMIAIALYSFVKITLAIVNLVKVKKHGSSVEKALRNISLVDGLVSIASLQRSMLVSFEGMNKSEIRIFNIITGSGVCIVVFLLGLNLVNKTQNSK